MGQTHSNVIAQCLHELEIRGFRRRRDSMSIDVGGGIVAKFDLDVDPGDQTTLITVGLGYPCLVDVCTRHEILSNYTRTRPPLFGGNLGYVSRPYKWIEWSPDELTGAATDAIQKTVAAYDEFVCVYRDLNNCIAQWAYGYPTKLAICDWSHRYLSAVAAEYLGQRAQAIQISDEIIESAKNHGRSDMASNRRMIHEAEKFRDELAAYG